MCHAIGRHGATLLKDGMGVLTHCNAGWLATAEYGTALAVIYAAQDAGKQLHVYADETRPLLQGARLTTWELMQRGVPTTLICDSTWLRRSCAKAACRPSSPGPIGSPPMVTRPTRSAPMAWPCWLARTSIPFYVAAPSSTFDLALDSGDQIPIEQRAAEEITCGTGMPDRSRRTSTSTTPRST